MFSWRWDRSLRGPTLSSISDRNGSLKWGDCFSKDFCLSDGFFNGSLMTAVFRSHSTMQVVRDVLMTVVTT